MKYLFLAIFVLLAAQPVQAAACDMHSGQQNTHSQHGQMNDSDMQGMDGCDNCARDTLDNCNAQSYCGAAVATPAVINQASTELLFVTTPRQTLVNDAAFAQRPHSPPFRPPIA